MSGEDFREDAVLAAVKPLKAVESSADGQSSADSAWQTQTKRSDATRSHEAIPALADARASDTNSLETLFQRHHDRVFRTAYRVTGSSADAEDVLQTVFLRVARVQETAEAVENAESYFARAAINASLDLLRSRKRSRLVEIDDIENRAAVSVFVSRDNPETHQEDRELRELLRVALAKLGSTAAQMFALRYFEGYGNGEIAEIMNTSALVVGVTLHRARARLRREIGSYLKAGVGG